MKKSRVLFFSLVIWLPHLFTACKNTPASNMNIVLELPVHNILKSFSVKNDDETFCKALMKAEEQHETSQNNYLSLFYDSYLSIKPDARLADIFSSSALKEKINQHSTNEEVLKVLENEIDNIINETINVLDTRFKNYGMSKFVIQRIDNSSQIFLTLNKVVDTCHIHSLILGNELGFYEVYDKDTVTSYMVSANEILRECLPLTEKTEVTNTLDSLMFEEIAVEEFNRNNPLFSIFVLSQFQSAEVGYAEAADTAIINKYLTMDDVKSLFPANLKWSWGVNPVQDNYFPLLALKTEPDGSAGLDGSYIVDAQTEKNPHISLAILLQMNDEGSRIWEQMTRRNIGKPIGIVIDGKVFSAPWVNSEITKGRTMISGDFTLEEAKNLAIVLKSGVVPFKPHIVKEEIIRPEIKK